MSLFTPPFVTALDATGKPLPGAKLFFYKTGTLTAVTAYANALLTTPLANSVVADAAGRFPAIYLAPQVLRARLTDASGTVIRDVDPVNIGNFGGDPVSLASLGARPDGTDAGPALTSAMAQAGAGPVSVGNRGEVYTASSYATSNQPRVAIRSAGGQLVGPAAATQLLNPSEAFELIDTRFEGWGPLVYRPASGSALQTSTIDRCEVTGEKSIAVNIEAPIDGLVVSRSRFDRSGASYCVRIGTDDRSLEAGWRRNLLLFNRFSNINPPSGSASSAILYSQDDLVLGHNVETVRGNAGEAWGFYSKQRYSLFLGGNIRDVDAPAGGDITGATLKGVTRDYVGGSTSPHGHGCLFAANVIRDIGANGSRGIGVRTQSSELVTALNFIDNPGTTGVVFDNPSGILSASLFDRVTFPALVGGTTGVILDQGGQGMRAIGTQVANAAVGWKVGRGNAVVIDGGLASNVGIGVLVNTGVPIAGLTVRSVTHRGSGPFFQNDGGVGTVSQLRVLDNEHSDTSTFWNGPLPRDCEIRHTFSTTTTGAGPFYVTRFMTYDDTTLLCRFRAIGMNADGSKRCVIHREVLLYRDGGALQVQGTLKDLNVEKSDPAWEAGFFVFGGDTDLYVRLVAGANDTIKWKVQLDMIGVG